MGGGGEGVISSRLYRSYSYSTDEGGGAEGVPPFKQKHGFTGEGRPFSLRPAAEMNCVMEAFNEGLWGFYQGDGEKKPLIHTGSIGRPKKRSGEESHLQQRGQRGGGLTWLRFYCWTAAGGWGGVCFVGGGRQ